MTTQTTLLAGILLAGLIASPVSAEVPRLQPKPKLQQGVQTKSKVPKAQLEHAKKRDDAKKQRDQKLKIRQKNASAPS